MGKTNPSAITILFDSPHPLPMSLLQSMWLSAMIYLPMRRIGLLLGSNPSADMGDYAWGPFPSGSGPSFFIFRAFQVHAYVPKAKNPGGLGAEPPCRSPSSAGTAGNGKHFFTV